MEAVERTAAYKLLSMAISYPEREVAEALESRWLFFQLRSLLSRYDDLLLLIRRAEEEYSNVQDLQVNYTTNFDLKIPLYESHYVVKSDRPEEKGRFLFELEKFYLDCGVELADRDMPDFIGTELEFMHYLCSENQVEKQRRFLEDHLLNWVPLLFKRVEGEGVRFYQHVIKLIDRFLAIDHGFFHEV